MRHPKSTGQRAENVPRRIVLRPHWSYSQISQFLRCPLQYYFERVARLPRPFVPSGMALGSAVHEGLAEYHRRLSLGNSVTTSQLQSMFLRSWQQREQERPIQYRDGEEQQQVIEQGVALLEAYHNEPPPQNIVAVEEAMMVPLHTSEGEFLEKPLVAVIDLLTRDETGLTISEVKTSGRRFNELEADTTLQASCYAHAVRERFDQSPRVRYTILVKTKTPAVQYLETVRTDADMSRLGDIIQAVDRAITIGAFYPIESPMNCSGCPFRKPCQEWRGGISKGSSCQETTSRHEALPC